MNKIMKAIVAILIAISVIIPSTIKIQAEDPGYYYESIDVQVDVNEKRQFEIVETLNVYYEEEKHGIIRSIPESSSVENYWISYIEVEGAPYSVEDYYDGVEIRIGDANKTVKGKMTYVLKYTLEFYQDYDQSADFIYLNLIGTDFDTHINKFTGSITYPENAVFEKCSVTDGEYGSRNNENIDVKHEGNTLYFKSRKAIRPYEAVTVQIQLNQGIFSSAPEYVYPYIIKNKEIYIEVTDEQDFIVSQKISIVANHTYTYYPLELEMNAFDYDEVSVRDFSGTLDGRRIEDDYSVSMNNPGEHEIVLNYTLHPKKILDQELEFELQNSYEDTQVEKIHFEIVLPQIRNYGVTFNRYNDELDKTRYILSEEGNILTFESNSVLQAAEEAVVAVYVSEDDYYRPIPISILITLALGLVFLAFVTYLKFIKYRSERLVDPISFYPPKGVNSAEAGYLIDNRLSDSDITSLIFQWASYGSLKIVEFDDEITLVRLKELPSSCEESEKRLFRALFKYGLDDQVCEDDLKYHFYRDIETYRKAVQRKYKKEVIIENPTAKKVGKACTILAALFPIIMILVINMTEANREFGYGVSIIFSMITLMPLILMIILLFVFKRLIISTGNSVVRVVYIVAIGIPLFIMLLTTTIFIEVYAEYFLYSCLICVLAMIISGTITQRTEEGTRLLNELRGFKRFIKTAEKEKLEMLLEEDPEYYYAVLPYAQTLKVTKIWQRKFEDIAMLPPAYYESSTPYSYYTFNRFYRNMSRTMEKSTVRPQSSGSSSGGFSSGGGGFSGGGGGFSSGGSSGGGSGGGGSRSW